MRMHEPLHAAQSLLTAMDVSAKIVSSLCSPLVVVGNWLHIAALQR